MGISGRFFRGPKIDMVRSNADAKKVRALFSQAVGGGDDYRLISGFTEDVSHPSYGFVHGSKSEVGNLLVGWNEINQTIVAVPTVPDPSGRDGSIYYRRSETLKTYRGKYPTGAFIIYPDRKNYIGVDTYNWLEDKKLYVYVSQDGELATFTEFFKTYFATR